VRHGRAQRFNAAIDAGDRLPVGLLDVVFDGHWRRSHVAAHLHGVLGSFAPQVGQVVAVTHPADQLAAADVQAFFILEKAQAFFDDLEGEAKHLCQVETDHRAPQIERSQDHVVEEAKRQTRFLKRFRCRRGLRQTSAFPFQIHLFRGVNHDAFVFPKGNQGTNTMFSATR